MKILCVAHQRGEVMAAVTALRGLPPEASVTWASSFKDAARWIRDNEDLAVLVLDAQVGSELCASFLKHLRGVGVTAPAIVVTSDGAADSVESLGFGPNDSVLTRGTLLHELPTALLCAKRLQEAAVALEAAEQRHAAETATAAARLADRQGRHDVELARIAADRQALDQKLTSLDQALRRAEELRATEAVASAVLAQRSAELSASLEQARQDRESTALAVERLARREAELAGALDVAASVRETLQLERFAAADRQADLEQRLARAIDERGVVEARFASAEAAAERLAHREHELGAQIAEALAARDGLDRQLVDSQTALETAQDRAARERHDATEQAARLAEAATASDMLARRLADAERARQDADEAATQERLAARERQTELEARVAQELDHHRAAETRLADAAIARQEAEQQHASEVSAAAARFAERHAQDEARLTAATAAAAEGLAHVEQELGARLADVTVARGELARQLGDTKSTLEAAHEHAARERQAETEQALRHETELQELRARLEEVTAAHEALDQQLVHTKAALEAVHERTAREQQEAIAQHASAIASLTAQLTEHRARLETELTETAAAREALGRQSTEQQGTLARVQQELQATAATVERLTQREAELNALVAEHASGVTGLEALVAERDAQLTDRAARLSASDEALGQLQDTLRSAVAARAREVEQLQAELRAAAGELESTRSQRDVWHTEADQVPRLQKQLGDIRAEMHRQFDQHPLPMCQCTREGVLTRANRAFADLVGCPTADEQRVLEVATTLFTASNDLSWLIERGLTPEAESSIEATWRNVHGGRLVVRLSAMATLNRILIVAQDITPHQVLQETLTRTRRMEAVGRLASEVAVTCSNLLGDVSRDGERWLATLDGSAADLYRGRLLLGDVARAASFLRQLDAYGEEQVGALEPVDLRRALHDLEPVLKEVAGDNIELVLPKRPSRRAPAFYVDLKVERVERLLVNVASYARERMRLGGSMIFDLAPAQVDREFVDKYPSVRPGPHVLLTVTEARAARSIGPIGLRQKLVEAHEGAPPSEGPGVDLGALHNLLRASGGHLWMEAEPPGDMVIKIHLPLREQDDRSWSATRLARAAMRVSGARR